VPNPFGGDYASFGHHNNAMLRRFLDTFGFDYEFASATDYYKSGRFDEILLRVAERYDAIMDIMLPTLGEERRATYSPFLPISPKTGRVLYVPLKAVDAKAGTITYIDEDGEEVTQGITGGSVKMQWKPDFGARWAALGVDFEMFGKDHGPNMPVYDRICSALGGRPPEHYVYELFLDQNGEKISKSKGNGLTIDEWLTYAPTESLALYMFQKPRTAKRLYFDVIPKAVDEYFSFLGAFGRQDEAARLNNPVWHIHSGQPPAGDMPVPFSMLLNLVSASNAHDKDVLWGFISRYAPGVTAETHPKLDELVGYAIRYFDDFVKPTKSFRAPDDTERDALAKLASRLRCAAGRCRRRGDPGCGARCGARLRALPGSVEDRPRRWPGGDRYLVPDALSGAARPGSRTALRFLRRPLRHFGNRGADQQGAGRRTGARKHLTITGWPRRSGPSTRSPRPGRSAADALGWSIPARRPSMSGAEASSPSPLPHAS
jgi:lysyl-tRNA synthetase class 1